MASRQKLGKRTALISEWIKLYSEITSYFSKLHFSKLTTVSLVISSLFINILSLALPLLILQTYDRLIENNNTSTLAMLVMWIGLAIVFEIVLRLVRGYLISWLGAIREYQITLSAIKRILHCQLEKIENIGIGHFIERLSAIGRLKEFYSGQLLVTMIDIPFVLVFLGLIFYLSGSLVLVSIACLSAFCVISYYLGKKVKHDVKSRIDADEDRYSQVIEMLNGIHTVKSYAIEETFERKYEALELESTKEHYRSGITGSLLTNAGMMFSQLIIVATMAVGVFFVFHEQISLGVLMACVVLTGRMMQPIQRILGLWVRMQSFRVAMDKLKEIYEIPVMPTSMSLGQAKQEKIGSIVIDSLIYQPGSNQSPIIDNVSLQLQCGDCVAIHGGHQSGKSTFLKLIAGIYVPTGGTVTVDKHNVLDYPSDALLEHVAYLPMFGDIFSGTILENINMFGSVDSQQVIEICNHLGIDKEIKKLSDGYHTQLKDSVSDIIPPGLKQRISIARALVKKPRVILFDEADRSLDIEGYNHLHRLLMRLRKKTVIVLVTTDHNLMSLANRQYFLDEGKLLDKQKFSSSGGHLSPLFDAAGKW